MNDNGYASSALRSIVTEIANRVLPEVCRDHVYRSEHNIIKNPAEMKEYAYVSWTFYNDQRVTMKFEINPEEAFVYEGIRLIPVGVDVEEWQADAIMRCEAGEDVWERPKGQMDLLGSGSGYLSNQQLSQRIDAEIMRQRMNQMALQSNPILYRGLENQYSSMNSLNHQSDLASQSQEFPQTGGFMSRIMGVFGF